MRDRILEALPRTRYRRFLVYLMGPYTTHAAVESGDDDLFDLLAGLRDDLREAGLNAFLATDVGIDLDEMDAGTQSLAFARASNAVVFVLPQRGDNLGVGIEIGAVLEDASDRAPDRALVVHEAGIESAMLAAVADRWDAAVRSFEDRADLERSVRLFAREVMRRETAGELEPPGDD